MKKPHSTFLVSITLIFVAFTLGFFLGRNQNRSDVQISVPEKAPVATGAETVLATTEAGIGEVYAQRILDYRAIVGQFTYVEQLLNVKGIGEKRLEAIYDLVTIGG